MKFKKIVSLIALAGLATGCVINVDKKSANVKLEEQLTLSANGLTSLIVDAGAGDLTIKGSKDASDIEVAAFIRTTKDKNYRLTLEQSGDYAQLVAHHGSTSGFWVGSSPHIDLIVTVPEDLLLDIDDGSGDVSIANMTNNIRLDDSSGDIEISQVTGQVDVDDSSGDLLIENIAGNVQVEDNSGDVLIRDIAGTVDVEDGSGELIVKNVTGKATIDDGSGDIYVINTGGLKVYESGSGEINITDVKGKVDIDS